MLEVHHKHDAGALAVAHLIRGKIEFISEDLTIAKDRLNVRKYCGYRIPIHPFKGAMV